MRWGEGCLCRDINPMFFNKRRPFILHYYSKLYIFSAPNNLGPACLLVCGWLFACLCFNLISVQSSLDPHLSVPLESGDRVCVCVCGGGGRVSKEGALYFGLCVEISNPPPPPPPLKDRPHLLFYSIPLYPHDYLLLYTPPSLFSFSVPRYPRPVNIRLLCIQFCSLCMYNVSRLQVSFSRPVWSKERKKE